MKYYLCGPFFNEDCSKFFDEVVRRCEETKMDNGHHVTNNITNGVVEGYLTSVDTVFVPGHFRVDFNKIKSEYDPVSFRRVLRQVLDLDINNLISSIGDEGVGLIVYPKGYDLGSMFELGFYLARNMELGDTMMLNKLRKSLIIHEPDKELIECIKVFISPEFINSIVNNFKQDSTKLLISDGQDFIIEELDEFGCVAINVDVYKDTPFNSMLAGYLYSMGIPFFTYSMENADTNVMMVASSLCHVKLDKDKDLNEQLAKLDLIDLFFDDSYFSKFKDIK